MIDLGGKFTRGHEMIYIELITRIRKKPNSNISRSKHKRIGRLFKNIPAFPKSFIR